MKKYLKILYVAAALAKHLIHGKFKSNGVVRPSFASSWLSRISNYPKDERKILEHLMKFAAGSAFLAGYETVSHRSTGVCK